MHLRSSLLAACLLAHPISMASADDGKSRLAQKYFAPEAAVRTLVVMATAYGERQFAQCVHDHYFGSPLRLRRVMERLWLSPEVALLSSFRDICAKKNPRVTPSEQETWHRAGNAAVLLEPDNAPAIAASADMIAAYANDRADDPLAQCVRDQQTEGKLDQALNEQGRQLPISLGVYEAYRKLCGLNPQGPSAADLALPPVPDIATVARERLLIVQDLRICESEGGVKACLRRAYQTRSKQIFNQLLSVNN